MIDPKASRPQTCRMATGKVESGNRKRRPLDEQIIDRSMTFAHKGYRLISAIKPYNDSSFWVLERSDNEMNELDCLLQLAWIRGWNWSTTIAESPHEMRILGWLKKHNIESAMILRMRRVLCGRDLIALAEQRVNSRANEPN